MTQLNSVAAGTSGGHWTDSDAAAGYAHLSGMDSTSGRRARQISGLLETASHLETLHGEEADRYARLALWHADQAARARRQRARLERLAGGAA